MLLPALDFIYKRKQKKTFLIKIFQFEAGLELNHFTLFRLKLNFLIKFFVLEFHLKLKKKLFLFF